MKTLTTICLLSFFLMPNISLASEELSFVERKMTIEQICSQGQNGKLNCKRMISGTQIFTDNEGNVFEFKSNATHHFSIDDAEAEPENSNSPPQLENAV